MYKEINIFRSTKTAEVKDKYRVYLSIHLVLARMRVQNQLLWNRRS